MSRGRIGAVLLALAALIASHGAWASQAVLPPDCRAQLVRQCAAAENRRACIRQAIQTAPDQCRKAVSALQAARAPSPGEGFRELSYGSDPRQRLDFALPVTGGGRAPLLLFVHGGGWSMGDKRSSAQDKARHFRALGWAFASTNYRLVPDATVEAQAADIAAAVALARRQPGVDPDRIVLMGHSAGAHLVALVGTDTTYLERAGVPLAAVRAVIPLDGAGFDVPAQIAQPRNLVLPMYRQAFGSDPERQKRLSPTFQASAPNVAQWLILPVASRADARAQAEGLARALRAGGARATIAPQRGKTHMTINRELGRPGDSTTAVVDSFLASLR